MGQKKLGRAAREVYYLEDLLIQLCYKDVSKCDMKACYIDTESWEVTTENRTLWKQQVSHCLKQGESAMHNAAEDKRARRKARHQLEKLLPQNHRMNDFTQQIAQIED